MPHPSHHAKGRAPAGGIRRFVTILAATHGVEHILSGSLPPLLLLIREEFGTGYAELGLLGTVRSMTSGLLQAPAGSLVDRLGSRRILTAGFLLVTVALAVAGSAPAYGVLVLAQALSGLGSSAFHPATYSMISRVARGEGVGKRMALHTFGGFLGAAVSFVLVGSLAQLFGWRGALWLLCIPGMLAGLVFWRGFEDISADGSRAHGTDGEAADGPRGALLCILRAISTLGGMFGRGFTVFLPLFLSVAYGMSVAGAGMYSSLAVGAGCVALLLGGELADRFRRTRVVASFSVASALVVAVLAHAQLGAVTLLAVLLLLGFFRYAPNPAQSALISQLGGAGSQGRLFGLTFSGSFLGGAVASLAVGWVADLWGMRWAFSCLGLLALARGLLMLVLERMMGKTRTGVNLRAEVHRHQL